MFDPEIKHRGTAFENRGKAQLYVIIYHTNYDISVFSNEHYFMRKWIKSFFNFLSARIVPSKNVLFTIIVGVFLMNY